MFEKNNIKNKKVLINLGGTFEAIDPIRGITNNSSGKMGLELAKEAYILGADLTVIAAHKDVKLPDLFKVIEVESSSEMQEETLKHVAESDIFIGTAAISDFCPIEKQDFKISSSLDLSLKFKPVSKIIRKIKVANPNIFLVGFKAEYNLSEEAIVDCAKKQIDDAQCDIVVCNDLSHEGCGFGSDKNEIILVSDDILKVPLSSKEDLAKIIFKQINQKLE